MRELKPQPNSRTFQGKKEKTHTRSEAQFPPDLIFGAFGGGFWKVFGWISDGFGDVVGSQDVDDQRFLELHRNHKKQHDDIEKTPYPLQAQRASELSERSERID